MNRCRWLAVLLLSLLTLTLAHAGERQDSVQRDDAMAQASNACRHAYTAPITGTAIDAATLTHPQGRITDLTGAISEACKADLTQRLAALEQQTGDQLAVLLVPGIGTGTIEQYATQIFDQWKLGQKNVNNGILLVAALDDHRVRIEVGYGLEGTIPDVEAGRIIREAIVPAFRAGDFEGGVSAAVAELMLKLGVTPDGASRIAPAPPEDKTATLLWSLSGFALANMLFGVIAAWRKIPLPAALIGTYLVAAVVTFILLACELIEFRDGIKALEAALVFPALISWPFFAVGCGFYNSRIFLRDMVLATVLLGVCAATGRALGYDVINVTLIASSLLYPIAGICAWVEHSLKHPYGSGGGDITSTASVSGSTWSSTSSSDSSSFTSSSDSFSGDGGASGGGGASDSW
ncbi:TPM domain-containing protein [Paraburkholderia sp. J67]|uniref:TPM domain-containing protein n=1 Tax=Paraburkholderia sp. J67 TaxID=2805435 RepID=UPI002ABE3D67|nr:TPM domain-containing protein [Paraburkholderia sp. J67]